MNFQKLRHFPVLLIFLLYTISINAQRDTLTTIEVKGKTFLALIPEAAPDNMRWGAFGSKIESYYGITAYSNGSRKKGRKYQCTELVHRFVNSVYGIPTRINMGLGHGKDLAKNLAYHYRSTVGTSDTLEGYSIRLENFENARSFYPPVVGSVVSMRFSNNQKSYGHVAIIRAIEEQANGTLAATLFDQHGFIHKEAGIPIQADTVYFKKDEKGIWSGQVLSWLYCVEYPVVSWTNPLVSRNGVSGRLYRNEVSSK